MKKQANIVIIYADQLRYDTIRALGNDSMQTPNIDRLVQGGVSFVQATTPCPVCMPARWSLHTGQWTSTHCCYSNHHSGPKPVVSMPQVLGEDGYRTALVGKNHSFLTADDLDLLCERPVNRNRAAVEQRNAWLKTTGRLIQPRLCREPIPGGVEADPDDAKTDAAIRFVLDAKGTPFFLWLSYHHPHTPYYVPEPYFSMYTGDPLGMPALEPDVTSKPFRQQFHRQNNDAVLPFEAETIRHMRRVYCGMISLLDAEIGRFLDGLEQAGIADNTLVVFMSDHGDYMGDHGLITKSPSLYECLVRTPLIMRWPGKLPANHRSPELVSHVDIMPTLLRAADVDIPVAVQGKDLLPWVAGDAVGRRDVVFSEYGVPGEPYTWERLEKEGKKPGEFRNPWNDQVPWEGNPVSLSGRIRMARTQDWKLIREDGGASELYDLQNDPDELINLYGDPSCSMIQADLTKRLQAWAAGVVRRMP